jgi:hypothetical protein
VAPCVLANCSAADQANTQNTAQGICNAGSPPIQLPAFSSLLNGSICAAYESGSASSAVASGTSSATAAGSGTSSAASSATQSAAASSSAPAKSGSGRIEGDGKVGIALGAMIGLVAIAFFAV